MMFCLLGVFAGFIGCDRTRRPTILAIETQPVVHRLVTFEADVLPFIERYCFDCHQAGSNRGNVAFDGIFEGDRDSIDQSTWGRVADALRSGTMPPKGRVRPNASEREAIDQWISQDIFSCNVTETDPGRVTLRRLNRVEYDHTIRDLFGFASDLNLGSTFPADDVGEGFDRIGDVLTIPPILMEKYLAAADRALEQAIQSPQVWARIMNPVADTIPLSLRKPTFAVRSEPIKRIGRPGSVAPIVVDPEIALLGRVHEILRAFADRAFRRPATQDELSRLVGLVESARNEGDDLDHAIRYALEAILISPHFLFLVEEGMEGVDAKRPQPVNDFALASRLSYFLTSSLPDHQLYQLAVRGELRRQENLAKEVERLLCRDQSRAIVEGFVVQWLQIGALREVTPDPMRFPDFDESLRSAMIEETCRFAGAIIQEDRSMLDFLNADFSFVNDRLARHYGIEGVKGREFRRHSMTAFRRGGILTQASFLTISSNPTRTSPVKRGKWVLETILGLSTLPPPEGVEGLKTANGVTPSGTIRQQLEQHRLNPACATCHDRMDPIGFGLENFDAIGAWRTLDEGQPIDASGMLPGGEQFVGPSGLRDALKSREESFVRSLAEKLLTYAIGRGLQPSDRCFVDAIVRETRRDGDRFSSLVRAIVASPTFQNRSRR